MCERELETEQRLQYIDLPGPSGHRHVSFSFSWTAQPEARGLSFLLNAGFLYRILSLTGLVSKLNRGSQRPLLPGGGFLYHIWSLTHLISNSSDLQLYRGSRGPLLPGGGFLYHNLSLTHLISNSLTSCPTELYNSSSAHSIFGMACLIEMKRE